MKPPRRGGGKRPPEEQPRRGRRAPPPEATGFEARYVQQLAEARRRVVARLDDGSDVEGVVVGADRDTLTLERAGGEPIALRKSRVRYIEER